MTQTSEGEVLFSYTNSFGIKQITAYVCGEKGGLLQETPYKKGETLNGASGLDIYAEKKLVDERLAELKAEGATDNEISVAMIELGLQRLVLLVLWKNKNNNNSKSANFTALSRDSLNSHSIGALD